MTRRPTSTQPSPPGSGSRLAFKIGLSAAVGLAFALALGLESYVRFPRRLALFKDGGPPSSIVERAFSIEAAAPENTWTLEVELVRPALGRRRFEASLNGAPVGGAAPQGRVFRLEFPGALLTRGPNRLEIRSDEPWAFRRLRVKEFSGHASGFLGAVFFPRANRYPDARQPPRGAAAALALAAVFLLTSILNGVAETGRPRGRRLAGRLGTSRYLIPAALAASLALPAVSHFRVWFARSTILTLAVLFFALAYAAAWTAAVKSLARRAGSAAAALSRAAAARPSRTAKRPAANDAAAALLMAGLVFVSLVKPGPVVRSGDSLEYVAMLVSWTEFGRPYVTSDSAKLMEARVGREPAAGESPFFADLKTRFPSLLKNGSEMDLPHFWFYSLGAAVFYYPVRLAGLDIGVAFMLLHLLLAAGGYLVIRRALGSWAGLCLLAVVCFSPLVWFFNKVHVELFTVVLASVGVALLAAGNWAGSALSFALASTQNPPFAVLAGLAFLIGFARRRLAVLREGLPLWLATLVLAALQPAYYLLRLGILNPVVATGAADMSRDALSLRKMLSVIVDPDIGLLANWPVAVLLVLVFGLQAARKRAGLGGSTWVFLLVSVPVLLWSQSRTMNLNHGGTYFISRYALWYLYAFFLLLWQIGSSLASLSRAARRAWLAAGLIAGAAAVVSFWPGHPEEYLRPTAVSLWIYGHVPGLYDPMPEIFTERYRGTEEHLPEDVWAVSNPSGNKILVRRGRMQRFHLEEELGPIPTCPGLDQVRVYKEAARRFDEAREKKYLYLDGLGRELRRRSP